MTRPFVIFGLPRSRTAWLARFLTYRDWTCGHEELRHCRSLDDVKAWFTQPSTGTVETAAAPWWRMLGKYAPGAAVVVVRRPVDAALASLERLNLGLCGDEVARAMRRLDAKLDQIEARLPCLSVRFEDLAKEETCAAVFEHCLPYQHDHQHWAALASVNVQCDMRALVRYTEAYRPALEKLATIAKHQSLTAMALRESVVAEGMTFQIEPFETWLHDARALFDEHLVQVGEAPGDWVSKNIPLMRDLDRVGAMQIMTARSNGRMFGYLMTVVGPSLETCNGLAATNATFFASPDVPGLGMKLQRAAARAAKDRGAVDLHLIAGVRGSGPRLGTMYRRMGAEPAGELFRLNLAGV